MERQRLVRARHGDERLRVVCAGGDRQRTSTPGGFFTTAGGVSANNIAKWNGSAWSALGSGMNEAVSALAVCGSDLYAGGDFTTAGGVSAKHIAKWNGSAWSPSRFGDERQASTALASSGTNLYAGGGFTTAGGVSASSHREMERQRLVGPWLGNEQQCHGAGGDRERSLCWRRLYHCGRFERQIYLEMERQ